MKDHDILLTITGLIGFFGSSYLLCTLSPKYFSNLPIISNFRDTLLAAVIDISLCVVTEIIMILSIIVLIRVFILLVKDCILKYSKS